MKRIAFKTTVAKLVAGLDTNNVAYEIATTENYASISFQCPFSKKHTVSFIVELFNGHLVGILSAEFDGRDSRNNRFIGYGEKYQQKLFNYLQLAV